MPALVQNQKQSNGCDFGIKVRLDQNRDATVKFVASDFYFTTTQITDQSLLIKTTTTTPTECT